MLDDSGFVLDLEVPLCFPARWNEAVTVYYETRLDGRSGKKGRLSKWDEARKDREALFRP